MHYTTRCMWHCSECLQIGGALFTTLLHIRAFYIYAPSNLHAPHPRTPLHSTTTSTRRARTHTHTCTDAQAHCTHTQTQTQTQTQTKTQTYKHTHRHKHRTRRTSRDLRLSDGPRIRAFDCKFQFGLPSEQVGCG